ncbi:hypothetical protein [Coleofasciculus sp. H7-2]|uniref:hypothetical protein n=1 Tax=Coleofasciculus sp. H7-2 TaxID=3351545 RepID=UPI00366C7B4D
MSSPEIYRGWLIEARPVFCVQVWSAGGECLIPVHNAKTEAEALELAKRWIDLQTAPENSQPNPFDPFSNEIDYDDDIPF